MKRDYAQELKNRVEFIREAVSAAGASGIVFANSGGKDSALVGILCKMACENTVSLILPCGIARSYVEDRADAQVLSTTYNIATRDIDLAKAQEAFVAAMEEAGARFSSRATANIAPRLRMIALYSVSISENMLVAGTTNYSEYHMGYFTKWGDGACDFNPIRDLTCTEVFEFLRYLDAPSCFLDKPPSAGLFDGQTDEADMGITYQRLDTFLATGQASLEDIAIIDKSHKPTAHKRKPPLIYGMNHDDAK